MMKDDNDDDLKNKEDLHIGGRHTALDIFLFVVFFFMMALLICSSTILKCNASQIIRVLIKLGCICYPTKINNFFPYNTILARVVAVAVGRR